MLRKASATILIILILTSNFSAALTFRVYAAEETDASTALKFIEGELEKGEVPSSSITEACFTIPEGFPVELAQRLWFFIAQLVSIGSLEEEIRRTIKGANDTLKLPARIDYWLKDYTIIPEYEKIYVRRGSDGSVSVEIPYKVVDKNGNEKDASSIKYESNGTNVFHILRRYPKKRTYLVRCIDPDSYAFTFIDLETGKIFNKTARMKVGLFSNLSQGYFAENFLVAVPGHFEETREVVKSQVSEFRVLLPAYDPIVVDTSISSTKVGIGDTITITAQIRNPQDIRESYRILLGARFSDNDAFEAWASPPGPTYLAPLYLRAKKLGIYTITVYFAVVEPGNLDLVFWNGGKTVTYTIEVLPEPPRLEVKLSSQVVAKYANLTITLLNKGGRKARDVKLLITGDVDRKELEIGTIVGLWSKNIITKLLSPIVKVNVTIVYYDEEGKRYITTALTTISTTNFVAPEEWRTYVIEVEGYNETRKVFVPGYQGATHVKLYFITTDTAPGYLQDFNGVKLIPISPDGFTLTIENASDILKMKALDVKYALIDVKPGFLCERILREDEVKKLLGINEDERLEPSKIPSNYEVKLLKEEALNQSELVTVSDEFYEWLKYNEWEDYDYRYEDTRETKWDLDKAATRVLHGKEIELFYHPLAYGGGDLVQGVLVRNYATCNAEYDIEVFAGPIRAPPEKHAISVSAFGSIPLHLVQLEEDAYPVFINLKHGNRVVATLRVSLSGELPMFWRGFWDGFISKGWGIMVTCGIMIIVGFVLPPKWAVAASTAILVTGVAMNIAEIWMDVHNALAAMDSLNGLADVCEGRSKEFNGISMIQHANELFELAQVFRLEAKHINDNLLSNVLSDLALDVSWDEIRIAFGLKEPLLTRDRDYRIGYATGRVVGAIASCAAYVATFSAVVNRIRAERAGGKPLSIKDVLRIVGRGIYNWITPAIWDALMLKLKPSFHKIVDLLLGNKYSRRFGDIVGSLVEEIKNPLRVENALETASALSKQVLEDVPNKESSAKILNVVGAIIGHYSLEELREKGGTIVRSIVSIWIKDGDNAIELLDSWLSMNAENPDKISVLEKFLLTIDGNAVKGFGLKIGSIIDSYLDVKSKYGEELAEKFLSMALKSPGELTELVERFRPLFMEIAEHEITLKVDEYPTIPLSDKVRGTFRVRVYWKYDEKSGVVEFWTKLEGDKVHIPGRQTNEILEAIYGNIKNAKEIKVKIIRIDFYDYRLFFPAHDFRGGEGLVLDLYQNTLKDEGMEHSFESDTYIWEGKLCIATSFPNAKNWKGDTLELIFISEGSVKIKYGENIYPVREVKFDGDNDAIRITYEVIYEHPSRICATVYSFKHESLNTQLNKKFKLKWDYNVEGKGETGLKERRLLTILGYEALKELESRTGKSVDENQRVVVYVHFDNGKSAYCWNNKLLSYVPPGAKSIASIEIIAYKELENLKRYAIDVLANPDDTYREGKLGEAITNEKFMDEILSEISKRSGIPKNKLRAEQLGKSGEPDFEIKNTETRKLIAVVEAKYVRDPENVGEFGKQLNKGIGQVKDRMKNWREGCDYGAVVVVCWPPEDILDDAPYSDKVGEFNNPYIEYFSREGG